MFVQHAEFGGRAQIARKAGGAIFDAATDAAIAQGRDFNGHGTYSASLAGGNTVGVAKRCNLFSVRVLDSAAKGGFANFMAGVDYVFRQRVMPAVVNMSLGGPATATGVSMFETSVVNLINAGVLCVVAAPDAQVDAATESPSRIPQCMTVGMTGVDNVTGKDSYVPGGFGSGFGKNIDVYAPGRNVCAAAANVDVPTDNQRLVLLSGGTSTAAPLVTGVVAMLLQKSPTALPQAIREAIRGNATMGQIINLPAGTPNRLLYSNFL